MATDIMDKLTKRWADVERLMEVPVFDCVENCARSESGAAVFIKIRRPDWLPGEAPCIQMAFELPKDAEELDDPELYTWDNLLYAEEADCGQSIG